MNARFLRQIRNGQYVRTSEKPSELPNPWLMPVWRRPLDPEFIRLLRHRGAAVLAVRCTPCVDLRVYLEWRDRSSGPSKASWQSALGSDFAVDVTGAGLDGRNLTLGATWLTSWVFAAAFRIIGLKWMWKRTLPRRRRNTRIDRLSCPSPRRTTLHDQESALG